MRSERSFPYFQRVLSSRDHPFSGCTLYIRILRARATGAPSLSVTRALPPARWWRSSVLTVRDAEFVEEIQSYCLGSLCRTANARTECARLHPRAARGADFLPRRELFVAAKRKSRHTRWDGYVRVKGMRYVILQG